MPSIESLLAQLAGISVSPGTEPPPRPTILFTGAAGPVNASPYPLTVTLSDSSNVQRVDFFKGTVQIGQALTPPYTHGAKLTFADNAPEVQFRAVVVDRQGESREASFKVAVDIGAPDITPPVPVLTASSLSFTSDGTLTLNASATDNSGPVTLALTRDSVPVTIPPGGEVIEVFTRASNGSHTYILTATDGAGNTGMTSKTVTVAIPLAPATVTLAASPDSVTTSGKVLLTATVTNAASVTFKRGSTVLGTVTAPPWILEDPTVLTPANNGTRTYSAVAVNAAGIPSAASTDSVVVSIITSQTRSRRREDYTLPDTPLTITKAALQGGTYGVPNADGWYEIPDVSCHSLTPGVPCILVEVFDVDLKVKIIRPVLDGLGIPDTSKTALIVSEGNGSVWVDDPLLFSSPPPPGGLGVACQTARSVSASNPREIRFTRGESYGTGGIYINGIAQGGLFRGNYVGQSSGYNIRGTGYNADGTVKMSGGRLATGAMGYLAQFFQVDNAPDAPENSSIVEYWTAHTDPMAMLGRNAGQREDVWNAHASAGTVFRHYLVENGLPWDPDFDGTQAVYGADPDSPSGRGYSYSGSDGLGDGYTKNGFVGTPGPNDVTHQIYAEDGTSLNNASVGGGVTAGHTCKFKRVRVFTAGVIRSAAPTGVSRLAVKPAPAPSGETGNNACQAFQFYLAGANPERAALFYGHEMDDLAGSFNWVDALGVWRQNLLHIDDPNGSTGTGDNRLYNSIKFRQNGVELPPRMGGIVAIPKPTSVADALATLDRERQRRVDTFIAAGKPIGMSDRSLGDVKNYWAGMT